VERKCNEIVFNKIINVNKWHQPRNIEFRSAVQCSHISALRKLLQCQGHSTVKVHINKYSTWFFGIINKSDPKNNNNKLHTTSIPGTLACLSSWLYRQSLLMCCAFSDVAWLRGEKTWPVRKAAIVQPSDG
jgi:hypothetical protein